MTRRLLVAGSLLLLWVAAAVVVGPPVPVLDLLTGTRLTAATESALVTLLCWLAVVSLTLAVAVSMRSRRLPPVTRSRLRAATVFVAGIALLGAGVMHRVQYSVCCATPATSHRAEQLVH